MYDRYVYPQTYFLPLKLPSSVANTLPFYFFF